MTKTFCALPWLHLATHPHGAASLCCIADHQNGASHARSGGRFLNLEQDRISDILNSDLYRQTRREMLDGVEPAPCTRCYREEERGIASKRAVENVRWGFTAEAAKAMTTADGHIDPALRFVELRLGNTCNVKCRSCNPISSSKWLADYRKLEADLSWLPRYGNVQKYPWPESAAFWDELLGHAATLELVYINGGEPTLIRRHWEFLKELVAKGHAPRIELLYSLNMTHLPEEAFDLWRHFARVQVNASIDDLGERNAVLRSGTEWSAVERNLARLQERDWIALEVSQTISWLNVLYVGEFRAYMRARGVQAHMNFVYDPAYLSAWILPDGIKEAAFERTRGALEPPEQQLLHAYLFSKGSDPDALVRGRQFNATLDRLRDEDCRSVFSELFELLDAQAARTY